MIALALLPAVPQHDDKLLMIRKPPSQLTSIGVLFVSEKLLRERDTSVGMCTERY